MDLNHWMLAGLIVVVLAIVSVGFVASYRILKHDEAIDAAHALALRELCERFDRTK